MALSFPLTLTQFSDRLRVEKMTLHCPTPKTSSQTAGGDILQARLGASLWRGEVMLGFERLVNTRGMRAMQDLLEDENASFIFSPKDYFGPALDPGNVLLGSRTVRLTAVASNNRDVTLSGLPAGYVLSADDLMSWTYMQNPQRWAFHRVAWASTANSSGVAVVEVWPRVRPGWSSGVSVSLKTPRFKAVVEESVPGASVRIFHSGASFRFVQSLR